MSYLPDSREFDMKGSASLRTDERAELVILAGDLAVGDEGPRAAILGFAIATIIGAFIWMAIGAALWSLW